MSNMLRLDLLLSMGKVTLLCVCLLSLTKDAIGQVEQEANKQLVAKLDQDLDGKISIKEAVSAPALLAVFGKLDLNGDGLLEVQELPKNKEQHPLSAEKK